MSRFSRYCLSESCFAIVGSDQLLRRSVPARRPCETGPASSSPGPLERKLEAVVRRRCALAKVAHLPHEPLMIGNRLSNLRKDDPLDVPTAKLAERLVDPEVGEDLPS